MANPYAAGRRQSLSEFVFFDLETTGLSPRGDRIIEIAAVRVGAGGHELDSFEALVRIDRPIPPFITKLTGIADAMLRDKDPIEVALPRFSDFIQDQVLVSYNIPFDMGFLRAEASRIGTMIQNTSFCALQLARRRLPGLSDHKLSTVAAYLGVRCDQDHRALDDCRMGVDVLTRLMTA
jgi:DNA polymerase III epsilon subunit family exonuclease